MDKPFQHKSKLQQKHTSSASQELRHQSETSTGAMEFGSVEEMLRYDAAQTPVPSSVPARLSESLAQEPKPSRSWWQRFFGSSAS